MRSVLILILSLCCLNAAAGKIQESYTYLFFDRVTGQKVVLSSPVPRGVFHGHFSNGASTDYFLVSMGAGHVLETVHVVDAIVSRQESGTVALVLQGGSLLVIDEGVDDTATLLVSPVAAAFLFSRFGHGQRNSAEFERYLRDIGQPLGLVDADEALIESRFTFTEASFEPLSFQEMVDCEEDLRLGKPNP